MQEISRMSYRQNFPFYQHGFFLLTPGHVFPRIKNIRTPTRGWLAPSCAWLPSLAVSFFLATAAMSSQLYVFCLLFNLCFFSLTLGDSDTNQNTNYLLNEHLHSDAGKRHKGLKKRSENYFSSSLLQKAQPAEGDELPQAKSFISVFHEPLKLGKKSRTWNRGRGSTGESSSSSSSSSSQEKRRTKFRKALAKSRADALARHKARKTLVPTAASPTLSPLEERLDVQAFPIERNDIKVKEGAEEYVIYNPMDFKTFSPTTNDAEQRDVGQEKEELPLNRKEDTGRFSVLNSGAEFRQDPHYEWQQQQGYWISDKVEVTAGQPREQLHHNQQQQHVTQHHHSLLQQHLDQHHNNQQHHQLHPHEHTQPHEHQQQQREPPRNVPLQPKPTSEFNTLEIQLDPNENFSFETLEIEIRPAKKSSPANSKRHSKPEVTLKPLGLQSHFNQAVLDAQLAKQYPHSFASVRGKKEAETLPKNVGVPIKSLPPHQELQRLQQPPDYQQQPHHNSNHNAESFSHNKQRGQVSQQPRPAGTQENNLGKKTKWRQAPQRKPAEGVAGVRRQIPSFLTDVRIFENLS